MADAPAARVWALPGGLAVEGAFAGDEIEALWVEIDGAARAITGPLRLELGELELLDGVAVARAVTGLRALLARHGALELFEPPQSLAHTLYRVGALEDGRLVVRGWTDEEPTTAN